MNTDAIIKQLEKALNKKDDKELRLRVEVLVDILKESNVPVFRPQPTVTAKQPKINGPGAITSANSEQITYKRPKGT